MHLKKLLRRNHVLIACYTLLFIDFYCASKRIKSFNVHAAARVALFSSLTFIVHQKKRSLYELSWSNVALFSSLTFIVHPNAVFAVFFDWTVL